MTAEGWRALVLQAVYRRENGDHEPFDLVVHLLTEQDQAKEGLRRLGFGVIGTPWSEVVAEIEAELLAPADTPLDVTEEG